MHLASLTLRGFKSFASATTLTFEPGITCVVGPNGSGKSNVVDALAWVMGEQGAKSLRGGKMEDVIFAGTAGRPPLGRAEVVLTIDNTDGALPVDFAEVTISRTMFRNGGSEYAINGEPARLLDVQELLSDSGIGREMHVIVGQGQLDQILSATPEERRGFVEEAAGVLKHRKRKEKALRKLDAMQGNLTRVQDLTAELRRQLKPLGRQAEVARRAAVIQADARDARLRLLADDLTGLQATLDRELADETALRQRRAEVEAALAAAREAEGRLESEAQSATPRLAAAQETWYRLSAVGERLRATRALADERVRRAADEPEEVPAGRDPQLLEAEAAQVRQDQAALVEQIAGARAALDAAVQKRTLAEQAAADEERRVAAVARAQADRREGLARLAGQVHAARSRLETRDAEIGRLVAALDEARARALHAEQEYLALEGQVAGLDAGEVDLDSEHESAAAAFAAAEERVTRLREEEREAERERAALTARVEALSLGLARRDGGAALLAAADRWSGGLGTAAELVTVRPGYQAAVAAALGPAADALAVRDVGAAVDAVRLLKADEAGQAGLLVADESAGAPAAPPAAAMPAGALAAVDLVTVSEGAAVLAAPLRRLLAGVVVVDGLAEARALVAERPDLVAVTRDGDRVARDLVLGGSASAPTLLEVQAAVDEAREQLAEAAHRLERLGFELAAAAEERRAAGERVESALARLHESDARMAAVAEQLAQLGGQARAAAGEAERLTAGLDSTRAARAADEQDLAELEERLAAAEAQPRDEVAQPDRREPLAAAAAGARAHETEARLALRTAEERETSLAGRADALEQAAAEERAARVRAEQRRAQLRREAEVGAAVQQGVAVVLERLSRSLDLAAAERTDLQQQAARVASELQEQRQAGRDLVAELDRLTDSVHRDEVARAEQRLRIEQLQQRAVQELGIDVETLLAEYGPDRPVPPVVDAATDEEAPRPEVPVDPAPVPMAPGDPVPYVRAEQEKRLRAAEKQLALLGKVNPLALEEYAALEERHQFLTEQLEDLKKTRRDLLDIVREVDERVEQVFAEAYRDVEREFEAVFARLFPGGEGRLVLTDPDDLLTTGIDVEARPPGKKVKRLSLLSGGERSLVAVAFLVALFKARPSPFYVLDEVEAALDDTNLGRLLELYEELRDTSQLIVITHQKRTMEIADALYGVAMRGDGVTQVISQRLREALPA